MHIIEISTQIGNKNTLDNYLIRNLVFKKSNFIIILLELVLVLNCIIGDYVIFKTDKYRNIIKDKLNLNLMHVNAILDNSSHAFIGLVSWLIVTWPTLNLNNLVICTCMASFIDLDHFISAKSMYLNRAISLDKRPFLHNSLTLIFLNLLFLMILYYFYRKKFYLGVLMFIAWFPHHVRDANR
jgi:hypothetical protein